LLGPALVAAVRIVVEGGLVYVEAAVPIEAIDAQSRGFSVWRSGRAGAVHFQLLRKAARG
jgi:16S rRNA (guanine966-N2)-methyltransferase